MQERVREADQPPPLAHASSLLEPAPAVALMDQGRESALDTTAFRLLREATNNTTPAIGPEP